MGTGNYDLIVIGGGPAGASGANAAAIFGKRVALIEREVDIGGAGINTGTVPSKTLRETALALSGWRSRKLFGVDLSLRREATIGDFMRHRNEVGAGELKRLKALLEHRQVERFHGSASFLDPHTVRVMRADGSVKQLRGDFILIATGSSPLRPKEFPFDDERVHDSNELLEVKTMPRKLIIVGAGVIGSEYAGTFAAMGVEVHLVDVRETLLTFLDREVSEALASAMAANGVQFHWKQRVTQCDASQADSVKISLSGGETLAGDAVLVCAGRSSNTAELNLAAAGIKPGNRGLIPVDGHYCSEAKHIYATGDVIGPPALAATSMEQSRIAINHALKLSVKGEMAPVLPVGVYTIPEASMAGETEETLREKKIEYVAGRARYKDNPRGRIIGDETGFLKLLFRRGDMRLLGVHVLGEQASELVHIGMMAMLASAGAEMFNSACFNYPTLGDLYKYATYDAMLQDNPKVKSDRL